MPQQFIHNLDEAITFFITGAHAAEHRKQYLLEKYSLPTEFDLDIAEAKYASSDPKGAMMAHILVHSELIQSDTTVYFFDDRSEHLQAVTESHARHNRASNATIKTCLVPTDYSQALHPSQKALYQSCLGGNTVEVNPISQEPSTSLNASFFLRVLAHPATKAVAALLVVAGIIGLVCGGLGLAGVGIGLSILASSVLTGLGSGTVGLGAGLGIAGFFSFSKLESKSRREELSTYEVSNQMH